MEATSEQHQADQNQQAVPTWRSWCVVSFQQLVIMWSVYILALGPIYWAWFDGKYGTGSAALAAFYEPLWILAGIFPALGEWINWYIEFWI